MRISPSSYHIARFGRPCSFTERRSRCPKPHCSARNSKEGRYGVPHSSDARYSWKQHRHRCSPLCRPGPRPRHSTRQSRELGQSSTYNQLSGVSDHSQKIQASLPATTPIQPAAEPSADHPNALALPPPPPGIQVTGLLGSSSSDHQHTLHYLYASQIATIVWTAEGGGALAGPRRDVIIGLALRKSAPSPDDEGSLSEAERETYNAIMLLLQEILKR